MSAFKSTDQVLEGESDNGNGREIHFSFVSVVSARSMSPVLLMTAHGIG